jgi:hypothetical protein
MCTQFLDKEILKFLHHFVLAWKEINVIFHKLIMDVIYGIIIILLEKLR